PLPNYVVDWLGRRREQVAAVVIYGNLQVGYRLRSYLQGANVIHSLNTDPWAQAEAMQRLFPHRLIPEKPKPQTASANN
ncbi:glycosyl hydrolase, partial [Synechococcus sp. H55.10]